MVGWIVEADGVLQYSTFAEHDDEAYDLFQEILADQGIDIDDVSFSVVQVTVQKLNPNS